MPGVFNRLARPILLLSAMLFASKPLNLGQGIWLNDSTEGNLASAAGNQPRCSSLSKQTVKRYRC